LDYKKVWEKLSNKFLEKYYSSNEIKKILQTKSRLDTKKLDEKIKKLQVKIITIHNKNYPEKLKNISNPPYFLYVR